MTVEASDTPCPDCGADLQVIYATELAQVVAGMACPECGFLASEDGADSVPVPEPREYVLRRERVLSEDDVRDPLGDVEDEFRARASAEMDEEEVWFLLDPEDGSLVDVQVGDALDGRAGDRDAGEDP